MKILWKRGEIAPKEQFLLFSTIFCCLLVDLCIKTGTRFSLRDKRLFEISEFEITRVDCISKLSPFATRADATNNPHRFELPISRTNFRCLKDVRALKLDCIQSRHTFTGHLQVSGY